MENVSLLFQQVIDSIDQGILYINNLGLFQNINHKAKDILGITSEKNDSHPEGHISPGDIVIIADNSIGYDDGALSPNDLTLLNIHDKNIKQGDMFVGIGVYKNSSINALYKHLPNNHISEDLALNTVYLGYHIEVSIQTSEGRLRITVGKTTYELTFMNSSGHMVIIDGVSGKVKFFQTKGYSIRGEDLRDILFGSPYLAKGENAKDIDILGKKYTSILGEGKLSHLISDVLNGDSDGTSGKLFYINKIIAFCSVNPIYFDAKIGGAVLKLIDSSELEQLLQIRNRTIEEMEKVYADTKIRTSDIPDNFLKNIIGNSNSIQKIKTLSYKATRTNSNIIITGESGTGKSQLAYEIHKFCRPEKPFVEVNCSAIPQTLFESELFGYVGGAFTGALSKGKVGYFEKANGGTIFLDEIGDLPLDMQVKLLQVLQTKHFYRVGSSTPVNINVRVIAATNKNLPEEVRCGTFRQDLYYRLNVFPIYIPPLRERKSDIYLLANKITQRICKEYSMNIKQLSGAALNKLLNYDWPGNIRELENVLERAITIADSDLIFPEYVDIISSEKGKSLKEILTDTEKFAIQEAINTAGGDKMQAISLLGISKASFYDKLRKYEIR
jgi:transcriptional regulator with PAS, ATPase and Fis domain